MSIGGSKMSEAEWLTCSNPQPMLENLRPIASARKIRLFAVACCRRIWALVTNEYLRNLVLQAEQFADGRIDREEMEAARSAAIQLFVQGGSKDRGSAEVFSAAGIPAPPKTFWEQFLDAWSDPWWEDEFDKGDPLAPAIVSAKWAAWTVAQEKVPVILDDTPAKIEEEREQAIILRDIFGNPFRPLPPRPEAIAPLAEHIYAGAWEQMPLLGEWLQEHGYWSEGEHCLDPNNHHVKGCWVVDWVTGRE